MNFDFPPDVLMLRDMLRRFIQNEARPLEMKFFNTGKLEPEERTRLRKAVEQLGLWGLTVPEAYGGGGLDTVTACLIDEELGKTFVPVEIGEVTPLLYGCQGEQVPRFLEAALFGERRALIAAREPGALQPQDWSTTAEPDSGEFVLNGAKLLAGSPEAGDFFLVIAKIPPDLEGTHLTAFILEAGHPDLRVSDHGECVLTLEKLRVGADAILGEPGGALRLAAQAAPLAWIRTGARYAGLVERLLEMAVEHARDWVALGAALSVRPAVQRMLAETRVDLESVRWLVYHAAWLADKNQGNQMRVPAAEVRLASGEMLQRAVDRVTMVFAGPGPTPQIEPRRLVRSVVEPEALDFALDQARAVVAAEMLDLTET